MAGSSLIKAEARPVSLRSVPAIVPTKDEEKQQMANDLTKMGYEGLLAEPQAMKSKAIVWEFLHPRSNEWEGTIWRLLEQWTADLWTEVYSFWKERRMRARRTDT